MDEFVTVGCSNVLALVVTVMNHHFAVGFQKKSVLTTNTL